MDEALKYQRAIILICLVFGVAAAAVMLYFKLNEISYYSGLALGLAAGLVKYRLRVLATFKLMREGEAARKGLLQATMAGHAVMIATLAACVALPERFYVWAAFGGMLLPNAVLIVDGFLRPARFAEEAPQAGGES